MDDSSALSSVTSVDIQTDLGILKGMQQLTKNDNVYSGSPNIDRNSFQLMRYWWGDLSTFLSIWVSTKEYRQLDDLSGL